MEAAALDEISGGRVKLGLGAALWTLRAFGELDARGDRPLTAMVEAIRIVRALVRGEPGLDGQVFPVQATARLDFAPPHPIPIYVGAVNARMLQAAGAWADGVELGAMVSPGYVRWSWQQIVRGAVTAGRDPNALDLASNVLVSVDRDARAARDAVKHVLAYYIHRVETVVLSTSGADPERVEQVRRAVLSDGVEAGARLVADALIDVVRRAGTPDHVAERLNEYAAGWPARRPGLACPRPRSHDRPQAASRGGASACRLRCAGGPVRRRRGRAVTADGVRARVLC